LLEIAFSAKFFVCMFACLTDNIQHISFLVSELSIDKKNIYPRQVACHQDIYVFHTLLLNINCKPHWRAIKLGFIKYDTHATCLGYIFFLSIDSSETRKEICWILSVKHANMQTKNFAENEPENRGVFDSQRQKRLYSYSFKW
jgi:hypothetical protein